MRVLRRFLATRAAHAGPARPGLAELGESGDVVDCHRGAVIAQLAPPPAEPVGQLLARGMDRDRGGVSDDRALVAFKNYPAESCYQVLLARPLEAGLEAGPGPVAGDDFGLVADCHRGDGGLMLGG